MHSGRSLYFSSPGSFPLTAAYTEISLLICISGLMINEFHLASMNNLISFCVTKIHKHLLHATSYSSDSDDDRTLCTCFMSQLWHENLRISCSYFLKLLKALFTLPHKWSSRPFPVGLVSQSQSNCQTFICTNAMMQKFWRLLLTVMQMDASLILISCLLCNYAVDSCF